MAMVDYPWPDPKEGNPHPRYGPCDSFGPRGECSECKKLWFKRRAYVQWEFWIRGKRWWWPW